MVYFSGRYKKRGMKEMASKIPLWGQKPSVPIWAAYLLQAELLWSLFVVILGFFLIDSETLDGLSVGNVIFVGLVLGGLVGPLVRGLVHVVLKAASWFVYKYVGPPPTEYW